jgi:hypothetical protein
MPDAERSHLASANQTAMAGIAPLLLRWRARA